MITGLKERSQDRVSLLCMLESHPFQVRIKNVLGLAHHFARDRRLIVHSFLQHVLEKHQGGTPHALTTTASPKHNIRVRCG